MTQTMRWGILGCGKIAHKFAADLPLAGNARLVAVASRDAQKSQNFANQYQAPLAFDNYEALVQCPEVDVIYIATPHGFHYEHALLCLNHRKAVLCEKAFALNTRQVKEMIDTARQQQVFLMEAFWTKFLPQYQKVTELINAGAIGAIKLIEADFGFKAASPTPQRLYDPALGGGALLDIGIYPVFLAVSLLGKPSDVHAVMSPYESGVDEQIAMILRFNNSALAALNASFAADTPVKATIMGTDGYIQITNRFHNVTATIELVKDKQPPVEIPIHREEGHGYQFEARHVGQCLHEGLLESPVMSHVDSLLLIETLDRLRASAGIRYTVD